MDQTAKHIIFAGDVQGIGFRFTALNIANRYKLTGWVRNAPDGTVEMLAQGDPNDINDCVRDIEQSLPGHIRETGVEEVPLNPQYKDFRITF